MDESILVSHDELWAKIDGVVYKIKMRQSKDGEWEYTDFLRTAYKDIPFVKIQRRTNESTD